MSSRLVGAVALLGGTLIAGWSLAAPEPRPESQARLRLGLPLRQACREAGVSWPPPSPLVTVRKADRLLCFSSGATPVKEYAVGLGFAPRGDKVRQGDGRTPEGTFYVCTRLEHSKFHRFLGLSYPGTDDAERGLHSRLLTRKERARILAAQRSRRQPPWGTALGGAVGLHGRGGSTDWTFGCIAVEDAEIEELFPVLPVGTPVKVGP